jgi:hypothetical protein
LPRRRFGIFHGRLISGQSFAETLDTHVDELPEDVANMIRLLVQAINPPPQVEEQPP